MTQFAIFLIGLILSTFEPLKAPITANHINYIYEASDKSAKGIDTIIAVDRTNMLILYYDRRFFDINRINSTEFGSVFELKHVGTKYYIPQLKLLLNSSPQAVNWTGFGLRCARRYFMQSKNRYQVECRSMLSGETASNYIYDTRIGIITFTTSCQSNTSKRCKYVLVSNESIKY